MEVGAGGTQQPTATVSLATLLDHLLQKAYHDLTVLQELLPRKSDLDRKLEIVQYARNTRTLVVRLLALVKWAGSSSSVQKCSDMSELLSRQSMLYVDTADQLVDLSRGILVQACTPNFSLAPAIDVLSTGTYPRLPSCIRDSIVPAPPLSDEEKECAFSLINCAIRRRLLSENVPQNMRVKSIERGVVSFIVPYEFELNLSVVSDELTTPWRLVSLRILVGESLPGNPVLIHEMQQAFLNQLIQSRLYSEETPLADVYNCLHSFCITLQLDSLFLEAQRLIKDVYSSYVKVEGYSPGHHIRLVYWRPGPEQLLNAFDQSQSWPKVLISVNSDKETPFSTSHDPPLPEGSEVNLSLEKLSLETLLEACVSVRSHTLLNELMSTLQGTEWNKHAMLKKAPLCLFFSVPLKYHTQAVALSVDSRVGRIVATVEPPSKVGGVSASLEELEKIVASNKQALPTLLNKLQCQLFLAHLSETATELGYTVQWSLPLVQPLPFHTAATLYIQLQPLTFLVVGVGEGLVDQYHLVRLQVAPASTGSMQLAASVASTPDGGPAAPQSFYKASNLIELDPEDVCFEHLKTVLVKERGPILKRKLAESTLDLPNAKRLCVYSSPSFAPLPTLVSARISLLNMQMSLNSSDISHHATYTSHGAPCINIFKFPQLHDESADVHELLSHSLQSCQLTHHPNNYTCSFIFHDAYECPEGVVLQHTIPLASCSDLGRCILNQWQSKLVLLGMLLELKHYLKDGSWPLRKQCAVSKFTYEKMEVAFGKNQLTIEGTPDGLQLSFSDNSPHTLIKEHLQHFLNRTRSLPLLLQGLCVTGELMASLSGFMSSLQTPVASISALTPPHILLKYDHFSLSMVLRSDSSVMFTDLLNMRQTGAVTVSVSPSTTLNYLQSFLHSITLGSTQSLDLSSEPPSKQPPLSSSTTGPPKPTLFPAPSPIASPRPSSWPSSPARDIPSIPVYPSPMPGTPHTGGGGGCHVSLTLDQFKQLLTNPPPANLPTSQGCVEGCSLLESFLGSLTLLYHFIFYCGKYTTGQQPQMTFVQCDRGMYTYRTENLNISLAMEGALLKMAFKPVRDNVWSTSELEVMSEFFKREVLKCPISNPSLTSFVQLLLAPLPTLKGCVKLMENHMYPGNQIWNFSLCLTVPPGVELNGTPFTSGAPAIIFGRGKLLLFLRMVQTQGQAETTVPLMHDPKTNITYVPRFQSQYRTQLHASIDTVLRKTSQEMQAQNAGGLGAVVTNSSLYPALQALAQTSLPI